MDSAFLYAIDNGMCSEEADPYKAEYESCNFCEPEVFVNTCMDVEPGNQKDLKSAVAMGPVSVAIEADAKIFQFYSGGVITSSECGNNLDHGVLIVGYGEEDGIPYWLVKNSWGSDWGDKGYVKIKRSESENDNGVCGIAMQPSFPVIKKKMLVTTDMEQCGSCGVSYYACCSGIFDDSGYPCNCQLTLNGTGYVGNDCGHCGYEYEDCCLGLDEKFNDNNLCICDIF
jgi:hypothetical protein